MIGANLVFYINTIGIKQMPNIRVNFHKIEIRQNGDTQGATWKFNMYVNGQRQEWNPGNVEDHTAYNLGHKFELFVDDNSALSIDTGGYEEDSPGFPTYDDHDTIWGIGPLNFTKNDAPPWGVGSHYRDGRGQSDISYQILFSIDVLPAIVQVIEIKDWEAAYINTVQKRIQEKEKALSNLTHELVESNNLNVNIQQQKNSLEHFQAMQENDKIEFLLSRVVGQGWKIEQMTSSQVIISR